MKATLKNAMKIFDSGWCDVTHPKEKEEMVEKFGVPGTEVDQMISLVWEIYEENDNSPVMEDGE